MNVYLKQLKFSVECFVICDTQYLILCMIYSSRSTVLINLYCLFVICNCMYIKYSIWKLLCLFVLSLYQQLLFPVCSLSRSFVKTSVVLSHVTTLWKRQQSQLLGCFRKVPEKDEWGPTTLRKLVYQLLLRGML